MAHLHRLNCIGHDSTACIADTLCRAGDNRPGSGLDVGDELCRHRGFRRTFAINLTSLRIPIHVTERLLNHSSGTISSIAAIYNRFSYAKRCAKRSSFGSAICPTFLPEKYLAPHSYVHLCER